MIAGSLQGSTTKSRHVTLSDVAHRVANKVVPEISSDQAWVGADHLVEGDPKIRNWGVTDDPMFPPTFRFAVPEGAILLHSRNPKKVARTDFPVITGEKLFALQSRDETVLLTDFLLCVLQADDFQNYAVARSSGSVNKFLNWTPLADYKFALPPIEEQKRICEVVAAAESVCTRTSEVIERLWETLVSATEDRMFRHEWQSMPLKDVLNADFAGSWGADVVDDNPYATMVVRATEMTNSATLALESPAFRTFTKDELSKLVLQRSDIVVEKSGGTEDRPVGRVAVWDRDDIIAVATNFMHVLRPNPEVIHPTLLKWSLWRIHRTGGTLRFQTASTNIRNLRMKGYLGQELPVPPLSSQACIVNELEAIECAIRDAERARSSAIVARGLLRERLLAGAIDVH